MFWAVCILGIVIFPKDGIEAFELESITWRKLDTDQGFTGGSVSSLLQDRQGFMWIGASGGLYRFDGVQFKRINPALGETSNHRAESFSAITCLVEDARGLVWIGSKGMGLAVYNPIEGQLFRIVIAKASSDAARKERAKRDYAGVEALAADRNGNVFVAWSDGRVSKIVPTAMEKIDTESKTSVSELPVLEEMLPDSSMGGPDSPRSIVTSLLVDMNERLWIGTSMEGLRLLESGQTSFVVYKHRDDNSESLADNSISMLFEDSLGYLWIGLDNGGVDLYKEGVFVHSIDTAKPSGEPGAIIAMTEDVKGRIWLGMEGGELSILEPSTMRISPSYVFGDYPIKAMWKDRRGLMWLGLGRGGLLTGDEKSSALRRFTQTNANESLRNAFGLVGTREKRALVLTPSGEIVVFDPLVEQFTSFITPYLNGKDKSSHLFASKDGSLWLSPTAGGLVRIRDKDKGKARFYSLSTPEERNSIVILSLLDNGDDSLWLGTDGAGIYRFDPRLSSRLPVPPLAAKQISALMRDSYGRIWAGSWDSGLFILDRGASTFRQIGVETRHGSGLGSSRIEAVMEDSRGGIWVGTSGAGLCRINPITGVVDYRGKDWGIHPDSVYGIVEDKAGRLWIPSSEGLYCLDVDRNDVFLMGREDGLPGTGFDAGHIIISDNGEIWVSGEDGVAVFDPDRIMRYSSAPDVLISDIRPLGSKGILERSQDGTGIRLPYDNTGLGFSIAVMDFLSSSRNRYAFLLEGRQSEWTEMGGTNTGYLAPLAPGKYMLRVKAANGNGIWNNYGASLSIIVESPWWNTLWFRLVLLSALILIVALIAGLSAKGLKRRNALLVKFARHIEDAREEERKIAARDVHDEIGQHLMVLNFNAYWLASHLDAKVETRREKINEMRGTIINAMDSVKNIAQRLRPIFLEGNDFPDAISVYIKKFEKISGIKSSVKIEAGWDIMPTELARVFFRILQEMVSNVARHSGARHIGVEFSTDDSFFILKVYDDGKGMDGSKIDAHDSFGIIGMRETCASEGGELEIKTAIGRGCSITARLPKKGQ
jgi:signal transduction histidine kinase/ligand-binding sensor domain-containing protein